MIRHLAGLADQRLIISFAPYTPYYAVLKRIGELFPGPSKVRRASSTCHRISSHDHVLHKPACPVQLRWSHSDLPHAQFWHSIRWSLRPVLACG